VNDVIHTQGYVMITVMIPLTFADY